MSANLSLTIPAVRARRSRATHRKRLRGFALSCFLAALTVFILESAIYVVRSNLADKMLKIVALTILLGAFPYRRIPRRFVLVLGLYGALFASAFLAAVIKLDAMGLVQFVKYALAFSLVPAILFRFSGGLPPPVRLVRVLIPWACFFALQAATLLLLVNTGHEPTPGTVYLGQLDDMSEKDFGILGYGNTYTGIAPGKMYIRPQGWFLEPSNISGFLLLPTFMSWGIYRATRRYRYLAAAAVCAAGLISAFSLAGFMGAGAGLLALVLIRPQRSRNPDQSALRRLAGPIVIAAAFLIFANLLMSKMYEISDSRSGSRLYYLLGRSRESQKLVQDYWRLDTAFAIVRENPFGIGLGSTLGVSELTSANAAVFWLIATGVPGIVILAVLYWYLGSAFVVPCLSSTSPIARAAAAAFIGATVQGLSYGTWMNPAYLFSVAILMLCTANVMQRVQGITGGPRKIARNSEHDGVHFGTSGAASSLVDPA